ncbi:MAG: redox-sensing transcriptional repressor Rex [Firmicutes bacterium]|nr:redox-sensing transcriptional repressor Rex [Bacillota bacterium]
MPRRKSLDHVVVPQAVMRRLPVYYRYLGALLARGTERVSSQELSRMIGITASQMRQDLSYFGSFGQQGYGYRVRDLHRAITEILGLHRTYQLVLVGVGNLGRALVSYPSFANRGFRFCGLFDNDPRLIGSEFCGLEIRPVDTLADFLHQCPVDIGVITAPPEVAQQIADVLVAGGVPAIWNFAPTSLKVPKGVIVEHTHISESLMVLSFRLNNPEEADTSVESASNQ